LPAAPEDYQGKRITSIRFEPAEQPIPESELKESVRSLTVGQPLRPVDVRAAIERLFGTGRYEDIEVDAAADGEGVALTILTDPERFVREVRVEGVPEPPNAGQLANTTKLELGQPFAQSQIRQAVESILDLLRLNGFYLAKVDPQTIPIDLAQQIDLSFTVDPGKRAKYTTPVVQGRDLKKTPDQISKSTRWRRFLGLGGWKDVTEQRTYQGIDRIRRSYQKLGYLSADVSLDRMEYDRETNRVTPHLTIDPGARVEIETEGARISRGKLRELVPVYQEQAVDKDLLVEGRRNILEHLESQGYFNAEVDFTLRQTGPGEQTIVYDINRGERHKLVHIEISGNKYFDIATIRERMYLTPASLIRFRHGRYSREYLERDINAIVSLYRGNGFRNVTVTPRVEQNWNGANRLAVFLTIEEGPQWFVNSLEIAGASESNLNYIEGVLQSSQGQPFSELNVATDQDTILGYYNSSGYPDATFEATTRPAKAASRVDLRYTIREGQRQFVRQVLQSGYTTTDPALIENRIRDLEAGAPLSQTAIIDNQRRLYDLGIFARVDAAIQNPDGETDQKYVLYRFEEARRYMLNLGFGAEIARIGGASSGSVQNPQGDTGFSPRVALGISRLNFLGQGHTVSLQTRLSRIQRRALASYFAPQFKGSETLNLNFSALYEDSRDVNTFNALRWEAFAQLQQRLSKANTMGYRVGFRRVSVSDVNIVPELIPLASQPVRLLIGNGTFIQDRRDDPLDAHKGWYSTIDAAYAADVFGGNVECPPVSTPVPCATERARFFRSIGRNASYHRVGRDMVLARSTSLGGIANFRDADVPLPERLFGGGALSHRGYGENQAGPRDPYTGFPIGGNALLFNTVELRFPLLGDNLGGVFFHDAGNVYSDFSNISFRVTQDTTEVIDPFTRQPYIPDFDYMVHAVGFGIRYRTPIGPIRVDLGYSINPPYFWGFRGSREELEQGLGERLRQRLSHVQFHFSLGQTF
jgi:outer membrane protein assembly complex protein YaeT